MSCSGRQREIAILETFWTYREDGVSSSRAVFEEAERQSAEFRLTGIVADLDTTTEVTFAVTEHSKVDTAVAGDLDAFDERR